MTAAGELAFWAALLIAAWGAVAGSPLLAAPGRPGATGFAESSRRSLWAVAFLLGLAVAGVAAALLAPDPSIAFASSSVTSRMPAPYRLAALMSRMRGELLVLAFLTATFGALAARGARSAVLCGMVLLLAAVPILLGANPYARTAAAPGVGAFIVPSWEQPYVPVARFTLLIVLALAIVAATYGANDRSARRWWLAGWGLGAFALVLSLRAALTGKGWGWFEWMLAFVWLAVGAWLYRRVASVALATRMAIAGAVIAAAALAGSLMRAEHQVVLETAESAELTDQFGSEWRFTSEGLSVYDELDRQAAMVLVSARRGARVQKGRVELRQFINEDGAPVGREVPVAAFFPRFIVSAAVAFAVPPDNGSVTLFVRFVPLFTWWWAAAALFAASAGVLIARERDA